VEELAYLVPFLVFVGLFALLHRRARVAHGRPVPVPWVWLVAIVLCAGAVLLISAR
jgi:hypothetical protein